MFVKSIFYIIESLLLTVPFWLALLIITNGLVRLGLNIRIDRKKTLVFIYIITLGINLVLSNIFGPETVVLYHAVFYIFVGSIIGQVLFAILSNGYFSTKD
jgi:hypothetical protein